jgi:hypothetical protein
LIMDALDNTVWNALLLCLESIQLV